MKSPKGEAIMPDIRKKVYGLILLGLLTFGFIQTAMAQTADNDKVPAATPGSTGLVVAHVGQLEITPSRANLLLAFNNYYHQTYLLPTIRFKIANTSLADVKVILFSNSITATDDLGEQLFSGGEINSSGIILSKKSSDQFSQAFKDEKGQFILLAPKQIFEVQLTKNQGQGHGIEDNDQEFQKRHRPKTITFSGTIGIIYLDTATELRAFSFSDVPVTVSTR